MENYNETDQKLTWKDCIPVAMLIISILAIMMLTSCSRWHVGTAPVIDNLNAWKEKDAINKQDRIAAREWRRAMRD